VVPEPARPPAGPPAEALGQRVKRLGVALQSPILVREMRALLRGRKFFVSHMLLMTVLAGVLLIAATSAAAGGNRDPAQIGKILFGAFFLGLSVVVIFLVPAFSCTAITTERESKTLDLLLTTTIRPWEIVWGKLLSALVVILLFMASALPLVTVCFLFGGISPWDLAILYFGVLASTLVISSVSLAVSAHCRDSKSSVVISYVLTLITVVLIAVSGSMVSSAFLAGGRGAGAIAAVMSGFKWQQQLLIMVVPQFLGLSVFAVNFAAASNRLKPATANRSTNLRLIWCAFLLFGLFFYALSVMVQVDLSQVAPGDWRTLSPASLCCAAPLLWLGVLYFPSEETILPPRVSDDIRRLRGPLAPLRAFMPGPLTGVAFAIFFVLLVAGGLTLFNSLGAVLVGRSGLVAENLAAAVPLALFLFTVAGLAAVFSGFGFSHRGAGLAAFGLSALLAFGPLILMVCEQAVRTRASSTLWNLHYLSPIVAMYSAWSSVGGSLHELSLPGGLGLPLWAASAFFYAPAAVGVWIWAGLRVGRCRAAWRRQLAEASPGAAPGGPRPVFGASGLPVAALVASPGTEATEGAESRETVAPSPEGS
jgi:ABC-type transport system involved in multi-copper enzyme maturation permease subunit